MYATWSWWWVHEDSDRGRIQRQKAKLTNTQDFSPPMHSVSDHVVIYLSIQLLSKKSIINFKQRLQIFYKTICSQSILRFVQRSLIVLSFCTGSSRKVDCGLGFFAQVAVEKKIVSYPCTVVPTNWNSLKLWYIIWHLDWQESMLKNWCCRRQSGNGRWCFPFLRRNL